MMYEICGWHKTHEAVFKCWRRPGHSGPHVSCIETPSHLGVGLYDDDGFFMSSIPAEQDEILEAAQLFLDSAHV